jgi:hypothetical protein
MELRFSQTKVNIKGIGKKGFLMALENLIIQMETHTKEILN